MGDLVGAVAVGLRIDGFAHALSVGVDGRLSIGGMPSLWSRAIGEGDRRGPDPSRELVTGAHAELAVDVGQVCLNGLHAHEQRGGNLMVGLPLGDELGDPSLGGSEVEGVCRPTADPSELDSSSVSPQGRSQLIKHRQRHFQRIACLSPLLAATLQNAQGQQCPGASHPSRTIRDTAVRTAGAETPSEPISEMVAEIGAHAPRSSRWSP